ncbi:MAG: hypothetical protein FWH01_01360 [Oscillospiraceae bacterium]|nr:hypothetical protein [Oscillospiraceae bacterium]
MFRYIAGTPDAYLCVLLYNFCAFAMQMPIGIIADKLNRNNLLATIGCFLVGLAHALVSIPVTAVIFAGIGNALFHIGGGVDVLNISEKKLGPLGVFVSPGAFGIYYGTMLGRGSALSANAVPLVIIVAMCAIYTVYKSQKGAYPKNAAFSLEGAGAPDMLISAVCLFLVVCLRSFLGLALDFSWKSAGHWGTALICAVVFGKTIGGFIADRFGAFKTALISLAIATILFLMPHIPAASVAAVLMFNMTMPITLWVMAKIMPGAKGFAFGLLTFGLFLGFLPVYLGVDVSQFISWIFALISAASLAILLTGLRRARL